MKFRNWTSDYKNDGLLYFAQRIDEMLYHYTSDLYKNPLLNSYQLILEYIHTAKLVENKVINEAHLEYILQEFKDSFKKDIIIRERLGEERCKKILDSIDTASKEDKLQLFKYLRKMLQNYIYWCRDYLKEIVPVGNQIKKIERVLRCYLPELICGGYSHEFIYHFNEKKFFVKGQVNSDTLEEFLSRFNFERKEYKVYVALKKDTKIFSEILEKRLRVFLEKSNLTEFKYDKKKYYLVSMNIKALDEFQAVNEAYQTLQIFFRFYKWFGNRNENWIFTKCMVRDEGSNLVPIDITPKGYNFESIFDDDFLTKASETFINRLMKNAHNSMPIINKVMDLHNSAVENKNLKDGFLNLWSILEIVCVISKDESKIKEIEKHLIPILQMNYIYEQFQILNKYLKENISENYMDMIEYEDKKNDELSLIAGLILLENNDEKIKKLYDKLSCMPLIRSRINQLNEIGKSKKQLYNNSERYAKRVTWHLRRLYRTRNTIIHDGQTPQNLKSLGEHLHSYIDTLILEIIMGLAGVTQLSTINNVLIDFHFFENLVHDLLKQDKEFSKEDIEMVFLNHYFRGL